jgi:hypothetical protein
MKKFDLPAQTPNGGEVTFPKVGLKIKKGLFVAQEDLVGIIIYAKPSSYDKTSINKLKELLNSSRNKEVEKYLKDIESEIQ